MGFGGAGIALSYPLAALAALVKDLEGYVRALGDNHLRICSNNPSSTTSKETKSFSVSWGYSAHIYERIFPRTMLKRPLETFQPWIKNIIASRVHV